LTRLNDGRRLECLSGYVKATHTEDFIDPEQVVEHAFGDFLGIVAITEDTVLVRDGDHGQAVVLAFALDYRFQGIRSALVPVPGDQHEAFPLAGPPDDCVR
jgi:hypothetical protein